MTTRRWGGAGASLVCVAALIAANSVSRAATSQSGSIEELRELSIEQLSDLQITSVSRSPQSLSDAPASIYVITGEEIIRSGARTVPEMLRLAPNLFVGRVNTSDYIVTARGFSSSFEAQNFTNKLLVLIDGRSIYNPLFSGMYWDMQDLVPENVERIEVISGPGATLWGANAVNAVINIIRKKAANTQGALVTVGGGNLRTAATAQYGGVFGGDVSYRAYVKAFYENAFDMPNGFSADDGWQKPQAGFRLDWTPDGETFTFQGDIYRGREDKLGMPDQRISGGNLQGQWQHRFADESALQVLAYYDAVTRRPADNNGGFTVDTYNLEFQHSFALGSWNKIVWGANHRLTDYDIDPQFGPTSLLFAPSSGQLRLTSGFVQDQMALADNFDLILGVKIEDDPYSDVELMPSVRATWRPADGTMLWAAVSRAVRAPTPFDADVVELLGPTTFLDATRAFKPEKLIAYEVGYRAQLSPRASVSVTLFDHEYDDLRTIEPTPVDFLPLFWGNEMEGRIYGVEAWGNLQVAEWWRLSAGLVVQSKEVEFKPGASQLVGLRQAGDDPDHQVMVKSSMDLSDEVRFDAQLRWIGALPEPKVKSYVELNARIAWDVTEHFEVSLAGSDLLSDDHVEFTTPPSDEIPRGVYVEARWKY